MNKPTGTKNMFAILCSYPLATKALIGKNIPRIFLEAVSTANTSIQARSTRILHGTPLKRENVRKVLAFAIVRAVFPISSRLLASPQKFGRKEDLSNKDVNEKPVSEHFPNGNFSCKHPRGE